MRARTRGYIGLTVLGLTTLCVWLHARASDGAGFPEGFDAIQAAPGSHKVIFENAIVRVLQVTVRPSGQTEPMHHHRGPSPGRWSAQWMKPEPMHAIESVESEPPKPGEPPLLRVEIKIGA